MKKNLARIAAAFLSIVLSLFAFGCNIPVVIVGQSSGGSNGGSIGGTDDHPHTYTKVDGKEATCTEEGNDEYYVCDCGKKFVLEDGEFVEKEDVEIVIGKESHTYSKKIDEIAATCYKNGVAAHYTCLVCNTVLMIKNGKLTEVTEDDLKLAKLEHSYVYEVQRDEYLVADATDATATTYRKSCVCGETTDTAATFTVGDKLSAYTGANEELYAPTSVSVSLYDAANLVYGFTFNTRAFTAGAAIFYSEGATLDLANCQKLTAHTEQAETYEKNGSADTKVTYYITKAELKLKPSTQYTYCIGDRYVGEETYTTPVTFTTVNPQKTSFKFAHLSDSQSGSADGTGEGTGSCYANVLSSVIAAENDFIVHTGDVVENSKYESFWTGMMHDNFSYLAKIPVMAISGNHETNYYNGSNETNKHFNYLMPEQTTTTGLYYSFSYGDVKFIMLNANRDTTSALDITQYNWLKSELENKTEKWTIVAMHNPMYSIGKWGSDPSRNQIARALCTQLKGLFVEYGVDLVLQGHDHCVSRTYPIKSDGTAATETFNVVDGVKYSVNPQGPIYVMNGPAGDQGSRGAYSTVDEDIYSYGITSQQSSWAEIEVTENRLTLSVKYYANGVESYGDDYTWGIEKTAQAD